MYILAHLRNDNTDDVCQVESINSATGGIRSNSSIGGNQEELYFVSG